MYSTECALSTESTSKRPRPTSMQPLCGYIFHLIYQIWQANFTFFVGTKKIPLRYRNVIFGIAFACEFGWK